MRSTFYGLEIAKTGLFTAQNQLDVTGHNMSNATTNGYTRQRVVTKALPPGYGDTLIAVDRRATSGRGVNTMYIEQVRNPFLDNQYRKENATANQWTTKEQYFEYVEAIFNNELEQKEISTGLTSTFAYFYNALYALVENPSDKEMRENTRAGAQQMIDSINLYYNKLMEQQSTLDESIKISVSEINDLAEQIGILNKQISAFEMTGAKANDLRDQRNVLLDTLSGIVKVEAYEDTNGQMVVQIGGKNLVRHDRVNKLTVERDVANTVKGESDVYGVYWADSEGKSTGNPLEITDGALRGYMDIRDGKDDSNPGIPFVVNQLNDLVRDTAKKINEVHLTGYTYGKNPGESKNGVLFFYVEKDAAGKEYDYSTITAKNFRLSNEIRADVNNIACSNKPVNNPTPDDTNNQTGNAEIALKLTSLIYAKDDKGNPDNLNGKYRELLSSISLGLDHIHTTANAQTVMRSHLDQQRKSISSVSLDEEMTNMIRFGHSYRAASRMITSIDEELDTLINRMGLVGRS